MQLSEEVALTTDLELHQPDEAAVIVHPLTGEAIDLVNAPDLELAKFLDGLDDDRNAIQAAKRVVSDEVIRRMDFNASYTLRAGPYQLRAPSPEPEEHFDAAALRAALLALVDEGVLSVDAVDKAVETVVTYRPRKGGISKLRKLGGRVREIVDAHAFTEVKRRYVSVQRVERMATYDGTVGRHG